jgi:predicted transposase/invertase (TIGR01784 family)
MDYRSAILNARDEGISIGTEKGISIGTEKGIKLGEEIEARKSRQNSLEAARKMKALGMSSEQIADILGLSPEETKLL